MQFLLDHKGQLFDILTAAHGVAVLIVNLTPTPRDNRAVDSAGVFLRQAYRAIEILGGVVTPLVKR